MANNAKDIRITELHEQALDLFAGMERIIDELKGLGEHSLNGNNALLNVREQLSQLSER
ncbi:MULTISPECIES: hypothetical protein [Methylophaga]|jgi:hypothetical protein|uniref:Uncharacterized protein n=1 Tax=Methylophaga thalassica TaxID=40223 RepID=A0ABQ5TWS4_9GAMM|nr:hypothetical protein [Methylophaga thalassica]GLQ00622.1 hypothetical protein GCM10007891_24750 [Methylophaga thalassica]